MKKFFLLTITFLLALSATAAAQPNAQPNYNFVRVSDLGAQAFVDRMGYGNIYQTLKQQGTVVALFIVRCSAFKARRLRTDSCAFTSTGKASFVSCKSSTRATRNFREWFCS